MKYLIFLLLAGCSSVEDIKNIRVGFREDQPVIGYQIKAKSPAAIAADQRVATQAAPEYELNGIEDKLK